MATVISNDQTDKIVDDFAPATISGQRPNRRLNRGNSNTSSLSSLGSSLGSSLNSSMMSMSLTGSSSTTASQRRPSLGSLRDRRGNLDISFTQANGLDASSLAEILSGFDSDDDNNVSAGSDVPEMTTKQKRRCSGRSVKWEDQNAKLETIESVRSLHMSDGSVDVDLSESETPSTKVS